MSSKKRKGNLPENAAAEATQKAPLCTEQSSQPMADIADGGSGEEEDHASTRMKLDESQAKLAAALLEIERLETGRDAELAAALIEIGRLRAAASEPCARCHFYSDWTVRVRTMSGQVHTIACPDGSKTLVAHVKQRLAQFDPKCHILQQVTLVLPCKASSSSNADPTDSALADDRTLASYGLSNRNALDLFLIDMNWNDACRTMIELIENAGKEILFLPRIDDDLALAVAWALVNAINPAPTSLAFGFRKISAGGASKICAALCALSTAECLQVGPRISEISFSGNDIRDAGADSCSELMRVSAWLKQLYLVECGISSAGAVSIGSALRASSSHQLELLNLNGNAIGSDGAKSIGAALAVNTSLQKLCICENEIDIDGVEALAEALKVNGSLRELFLDDNGIDPASVAFLADALQLNSSLRHLSLGSNDIGDDGAVLLSAALRVNSGLESIDLDQNEIGDRGAASFRAALRVNTSLQSFDLSHNDIGGPGAAALGIALALNSSLTCIKLDNNHIDDAGAVALGEALYSNAALTTLTLFDNKIGALGAESIGKAQRENSRLEPIELT